MCTADRLHDRLLAKQMKTEAAFFHIQSPRVIGQLDSTCAASHLNANYATGLGQPHPRFFSQGKAGSYTADCSYTALLN